MKKFWKKTEGFTLVELIVVIAILGILAGVGTVGYSGYVKKANMAADETLLGTINAAFATACIENGMDMSRLSDAEMPLDANYKVEMDNVTPYKDSFAKYYGESKDSAFKVYKSIGFSPALGRFIAAEAGMKESTQNGKTYRADGTDILLYQNSTWGKTMTPQQTLDMAQNTVELVSTMYSNYLQTMNDKGNYTAAAAAALGMSDSEYTEYFNSLYNAEMESLRAEYPNPSLRKKAATAAVQSKLAVLVAAKDAKTESVNIIDTLTKDGGAGAKDFIKDNVEGDAPTTGLSQAALAYGLYNAYVQSNDSIAADDKANASKPGNAWANLNSEGFQNYLKTSQAKDDLAGLLAAFNAIGDQDQATIKHTVENGYNNADISAAMGELLNGGN